MKASRLRASAHPSPPVGLLPAAGRGLRFGASGYAKELFPLLFAEGQEDQTLSPRPIAELALGSIQRCGAEQCVVVISPEKAEVLRVLGASDGLSLAYVIQDQPLGLPHALRCARPWLGGHDVALALPDTIVLPFDALAVVSNRQRRTGADVVLGVFPVEEPRRLGPVEFDSAGRVERVLDKPKRTKLHNSWAVAAWSPRFTDFCCDWDLRQERTGAERALGHSFEAARRARLDVRAVFFAEGIFLDIGTPAGLRGALRVLADRGLLDPVQATTAAHPSPRRRPSRR